MFDEANASGLLLNNLMINPKHMISLDSEAIIEDQPLYQPNPQQLELISQEDVKSIKAAMKHKEISIHLKEFIQELRDEINNWSNQGYQNTDKITNYMGQLA